jgi:maleamate amidohydrolase
MNARIWDGFLTKRDKEVFAASGFGARAGFGKRLAVLVVDVNYAFCGDRREPVLESIKRWRQSGGEAAWDALPVLARFIEVARVRSGERPLKTNISGDEIMPQIAPGPKDLVIRKQKPSAFFATPLQSYLTLLRCDTLIVMGTATSGCVRASVTDAFSHNYRVVLVEDGVFERSEASHAVSLCDMNAKYADVVPSGEVIAYMSGLPKGMFDLPKGDP